MADEDSVLRDNPLEAADLVDRPDDWYIEDDEILVICGIEFPAREFTEAQRLEWLDVRDKHELSEAEAKYRDILLEIQEADNSTLLKAKRKRLEHIEKQIDKVIETTEPFDWVDQMEEWLAKISAEADRLREDIAELQKPLDQKLYNRMDEMQKMLADVKDTRDPAFLEMAWKIARQEGKTDMGLDEWLKKARGSDRLAAQELVHKGNFTWEAMRLNRSQRRALARSQRKTKNSTSTNTAASTSKQ